MNKSIFTCVHLFLMSFLIGLSAKSVYIVPFAGYDTATFGQSEDERVFLRLKASLNALGHECKYIYTRQIEQLSNDDVEYLVLLNYSNTPEKYLKKIDKDKLVLMCFEPPVVEPQNHDRSVHKYFGKIITCFDNVSGPQYYKFFYWSWVDHSAMNASIPFAQRKLATLINGCKSGNHDDELYSQRLNVVKFFEKQKGKDFDFYGRGWDSKKYKNYCGAIPTISGKGPILGQYRFCFCFENIKNVPGYITEKILDCLNAGCVPIYWGAPNIDRYIPRDCYLLREDFGSWQGLYDCIRTMPEETYQRYIDNINNYLTSDAAFLFSQASFVDSVLSALFPGYDRTKVFDAKECASLNTKDAWLATNFNPKMHGRFSHNGCYEQRYGKLLRSLENFHPTTNKNFVVIIASYNNKDWYKRNLDSVFMQQYDNYHVIYVDDCSPDGTGNLVEQYIKETHQEDRVTLIKNTRRMGAMANFYNAIHLCDGKSIVVQLDGDDWFAHDRVLDLLNKVYADPNVWLTYGQFERYPSGERGTCKDIPSHIIKHNKFRSYSDLASALRTFYAGLFKLIKKEDLLFEGEFLLSAHDMAIMIPMFEMAGYRSKFIPDVLYIYNRANCINDDKVNISLQHEMDEFIRAKEKYVPCEGLV
jgi:hypothetical protein